jgi:hypothetical protein
MAHMAHGTLLHSISRCQFCTLSTMASRTGMLPLNENDRLALIRNLKEEERISSFGTGCLVCNEVLSYFYNFIISLSILLLCLFSHIDMLYYILRMMIMQIYFFAKAVTMNTTPTALTLHSDLFLTATGIAQAAKFLPLKTMV